MIDYEKKQEEAFLQMVLTCMRFDDMMNGEDKSKKGETLTEIEIYADPETKQPMMEYLRPILLGKPLNRQIFQTAYCSILLREMFGENIKEA